MTEETTNKKEKSATGTSPNSSKNTNVKGQRQHVPRRRNPRRKSRRARVRPEFDHRVIDIRRVTRVVAGGRRFSFSVTLVAGNKRGSVGVGVGKATDTALAIEKAQRDAKKHIMVLKLTGSNSLPHEVEAKYSSAVVKIFPAPGKTGITAGGAVRTVLELAGIKGVSAKILSRSKNKLNNARAAVEALSAFEDTKAVVAKKKNSLETKKHKTKKT